jgi:quercetin dioxygenase-like cupin family protein
MENLVGADLATTMQKFNDPENRHWHPVDVRGTTMDKCTLWEGRYDTRAGLFRMPAGMQIAQHLHTRWVQVFVVEGAMRVDNAAGDSHTVSAGGYYFVEPDESHVETAFGDTLVLVIQAEDRDGARGVHERFAD